MPIKHLLKQIETYATKRANRDVRPDWLTDFVNEIAELFEPITGVGRVGFDCQLAEDCWVVGMYLGSTEMMGGPEDGSTKYLNFEFDLQQLIGRFQQIDEFVLSSFPNPRDFESSTARSFITLAGSLGEHPIRLQVFTIPPDDAGPGLKQFQDGNCEPA